MLSKVSPREFAIQKHGDQKYGTSPYSYHLDAVAGLAVQYFTHLDEFMAPVHPRLDHVLSVAFLHDILEDTDVEIGELRDSYGFAIADDVYCLTDEDGANRKERKLRTWHKIRSSPVALYIKLCDRLANTKESLSQEKHSLLGMYQKEFPLFEAALYIPDSPLEVLWQDLKKVTGK